MPLPASVCLYCGSSDQAPREHWDLAATLGRMIAAAGVTLIYGGGRVGLMGAAADAALAAGGRVVGIIPRLLVQREVAHSGLTELITVETMHERKRLMCDRAEGFCVLPGGLGTLDETFEILTWAQLGLHTKPVVLLNHRGWWDPLVALLDHMQAARYVDEYDRELLQVVDAADEVLPLLGWLTGDDEDGSLSRA